MANITQPAEPETEAMKGLLVKLPEDFHTELKVACVRLKTGMNEFAVEALREAMKRAKKELANAR